MLFVLGDDGVDLFLVCVAFIDGVGVVVLSSSLLVLSSSLLLSLLVLSSPLLLSVLVLSSPLLVMLLVLSSSLVSFLLMVVLLWWSCYSCSFRWC